MTSARLKTQCEDLCNADVFIKGLERNIGEASKSKPLFLNDPTEILNVTDSFPIKEASSTSSTSY